jgi:hypothetical protein
MMLTPEDMPEVARNLHLLRRGIPQQKLAVSLNSFLLLIGNLKLAPPRQRKPS